MGCFWPNWNRRGLTMADGNFNSDCSEVRGLLAEFRKDWAWRLEGCSDPACLSCQRRKDFITRIDKALAETAKQEEALNG